ncbi:unnamed protein product [Linum tenue]|uniref:20 kDa chaperonin, chloroplastic n=1 Tax=Linum tenue TaxID=586396 RepID=A0AAV0JAN8_9ROSI|nr:unnamed protein product [Linum tenue]
MFNSLIFQYTSIKPLGDRVLVKIKTVEEKTGGGILLPSSAQSKPQGGEVIAVGPGPLDEEGNTKPLSISPGNTVLYSKYAGNDFKGTDGSNYIALRASDVMAVLS